MKKLKLIISILFMLIITLNSKGQSDDEKSNILTYTPSKLLNKGQVEVQFFNNIYTQTAYRDETGEKIDMNGRSSYYTGFIRALFGVSSSTWINVGFDVNLKSVRNDSESGSSAFKVLKFANDSISRTALTSIGPKVKISPFKKLSGFSIQSAFWIPLAKDMEGKENGKPWLAYDKYTWWNQFFFDKTISNHFQFFAEADLLFRFEKDFELKNTSLDIPVSAFVNYFPTTKSTIYGMVQYSPTVTSASTYYTQIGIGGKYQITKHFNIELLYTNFIASKNGGAGETYNIGIRYIR